ncbi:uncharacterized protein LOC132702810 isoform X2 [Cylas formicarius]|uniref:uncharacterized protein LOC132702810 isoform X2 n=1 Tax=Cylas formicarius TaxID=197179 RepID=UPI0029584D9F|nr:uncharacterized protein LOC132702810 isoform X2 [Cylas formicarius]
MVFVCTTTSLNNKTDLTEEPACFPCCKPCIFPGSELKQSDNFPEFLVCFRDRQKKDYLSKSSKRKEGKRHTGRVKKSKSRELRAGILYSGCACEKRDGLQCANTEN